MVQVDRSRRRMLLCALLCLLPAAPAGAQDVAAGLTEALVVGTERVVARLGRPGGFLDDPKARIPLPGPLEQAQGALRMAGMSGLVDDLETRMNRAAEQATPLAKDLIIEAIRDLSFKDAMSILKGPEDSATRYLDRTTADPLARKMRPIVDGALADAGALQALDNVAGEYRSLPFVGGALDVDLTGHVVTYAEKAIFGYLARQEAAIRSDPAVRTTDLLRSVFGG
ncbi:MAG TPA: DUF4197 domain-containing protein [Geminicoccaceae bacterium]|nr:DUF4197 domain-containing protein [Geminicoccaceae bacterium]